MKTCITAPINERKIAYIWQNYCENKCFFTEDGYIEIIYPGRCSNDSGCDFQDAVFNIGGGKVVGDVEIHVKAKQWYQHGHHINPAYNRVALHIVMWNEYNQKTLDSRGREIPTICLSHYFIEVPTDICKTLKPSTGFGNCWHRQNTDVDITGIRSLLVACGRLRFSLKAKAIEEELNVYDTEQVAYKYLARALGYCKNTVMFEEIAQRLPISTLKSNSIITDVLSIKTMFMGTSGLLPSQRSNLPSNRDVDEEEIRLEDTWARQFSGELFYKYKWIFHRVRLYNSPVRRLVALSILLHRFRRDGLYESFINLINESHEAGNLMPLIKGITITDEKYWGMHYDFGLQLKRKSAVLGYARAGEIIINTILPFAYVSGARNANNNLKDISMQLYLNSPGLERNHIIRYMQALLFNGRDCYLNAVTQQGLIYIFKHYCRFKNCSSCPVSSRQKIIPASHPS